MNKSCNFPPNGQSIPPQQGQHPQYIPPQQQYYAPQPQNFAYPAQSYEQPQNILPLRKAASVRDLIFAAILALLTVLSANFYLWGGAGLGAAISTALTFLAGAFYLAKHHRKITLYGIFCGFAYLVGAGSLVFHSGGFLKFLMALCLMILGTVCIMETMQLRRSKDSSYRTLGDFFYAAFALSFGSIGRCVYAIFHRDSAEGTPEKRKVGVVLVGVACALPLLFIIVPLLMSSDAAFSGLLEKLALDRVGELVGSLILGLAACLLIFGRLFSAPLISRDQKDASGTAGIVPTAIGAFLGTITLVYVIYLFSQLAYFFNAFSGLLPENFTVAEYARQGFFEMCAVCAINLLIIFLATLLCKKDKPMAPLSVRLFSLFFCLFSLILIATALSKMFLYIDSFGMTHLRIYTSVFMVFLAIVFLSVGVRLFVWKVPYMKIAVAAASLLLIATCYANVDGIVAEYNVNAYKTGKLDSIDMDTLWELNRDSAVPWLLELTDDKDATVADNATRMLESAFRAHFEADSYWADNEYKRIYEDKPMDWRAYNISYAKAHKLLRQWGSDKFTEK